MLEKDKNKVSKGQEVKERKNVPKISVLDQKIPLKAEMSRKASMRRGKCKL
jgi:hypothetical protein